MGDGEKDGAFEERKSHLLRDGFFDNFFEDSGFVFGEVGEDFSVELDIFLLQRVYKFTVRNVFSP